MSRFAVVGTSGSGKTTLGRAISERLGVPHVELDALFHGPDWTEPAPGVFEADVAMATAGDAWVVCGNYSRVRDMVWGRATHVVWLDYSRPLVMTRIVRRTLRRMATGEELWNGNRERWQNLWDPRPHENIVLWTWTRHGHYRDRYEAAMADPRWAHLVFVRLHAPSEAEAWLATL